MSQMIGENQLALSAEIISSDCLGVITDMDGLLLDSESWAINAWIMGCKELGYELPLEIAFSGVGLGREPFKKRLREFFGAQFDVETATKYRVKMGNEILQRDGMAKRPGADEFLNAVRSSKLPFGLATSTFKEEALLRMKYANIDAGIFDAITFGDEITKLKPEPEIYLNVAQKLNIDPEKVVAFEDSLSGVNSALAAGMKVICIPDMVVYSPPNHPNVILKKSLLECIV